VTDKANSPASAVLELLASMRFAVSLLTVVAIASTLGTVLKQGEPYANYLEQFGPFWFPVFERLGLYSVYSAWWFLLILAFLVTSTSLCIARNGPRMLREVGRFHDTLRERGFDNFAHRAAYTTALSPDTAVQRLAAYLQGDGFKLRIVSQGESTLIAAQAGMYRRLGYILAHSAIVLICLGGLADSEALLRLQLFMGAKKPVAGNVRLSDVPLESRMGLGNPSFRGNMLVPEGRSGDKAVLNFGDGLLVQDLPFSLSLKKFTIEHYSTGQPKLFASDVIVTDLDTQKSFEARIEVNKPLIHRGIAVYQASFDDGGTLVKMAARNLAGGAQSIRAIEGRIGDTLALDFGGATYQLELTAFRPFNIENVGGGAQGGIGAQPGEAAASLFSRMRSNLGAAAKPDAKKDLRNVGPSFQYKLRDTAGQAREYHNYMLPLQVDGHWFLMTGMRTTPGEQFRFLRMPLDESASLDEYIRLRDALFDRTLYGEIGARFVSGAASGDAMSETMRTRLDETVARVLETFSLHGFQAVADFLERAVPEADREKAAEIYVRVLQGAAWEAWMLGRERAGLKRLEATPERARFVQDALNAASDTFFYGPPLYLQMGGFNEIKASVFQLTRSPGKNIVYFGCLLLVLGIFAMFYLRERRLWLLVKPSGEVKFAFSANRRTLDMDEEFSRHRDTLPRILS
jgi:cytochrome c biogenesis protein